MQVKPGVAEEGSRDLEYKRGAVFRRCCCHGRARLYVAQHSQQRGCPPRGSTPPTADKEEVAAVANSCAMIVDGVAAATAGKATATPAVVAPSDV